MGIVGGLTGERVSFRTGIAGGGGGGGSLLPEDPPICTSGVGGRLLGSLERFLGS